MRGVLGAVFLLLAGYPPDGWWEHGDLWRAMSAALAVRPAAPNVKHKLITLIKRD